MLWTMMSSISGLTAVPEHYLYLYGLRGNVGGESRSMIN